METLQGIELPAAIWKAMYLLALKRIRRRSRTFAERLCAEALFCLRRDATLLLLHGGIGNMSRTRDHLERFQEWMKGLEEKRLTAPRPFRESLEGLYSGFRLVGAKLRRLPRKSWPNHVEDYWFLLGREGKIPQKVMDDLANLGGSITEAALMVVAAIHGRKDRKDETSSDGLRTQFAKKRWPLRIPKSSRNA